MYTHFFFTFVRILRVTPFYSCTRRVEITRAASFVEFFLSPPPFFLPFIYIYTPFFIFLYRRSNAPAKFRFPSLAQRENITKRSTMHFADDRIKMIDHDIVLRVSVYSTFCRRFLRTLCREINCKMSRSRVFFSTPWTKRHPV